MYSLTYTLHNIHTLTHSLPLTFTQHTHLTHSLPLTLPLTLTLIALHHAAENCNHMTVKLLVEAGVPISAENKDVSYLHNTFEQPIHHTPT